MFDAIVAQRFWPACAVVLLLLLSVPQVNASTLPFETLSQGVSSGYQSPATLIIRDNTTWQALWNNLTAIEAPPQKPATPDFSTQMAIAAMMGPQPTCSSSIHIQRISVQNGQLQINITKVYGRDGDFLCPTDISPFHVVQTQRFDGPATTSITIQSGGAPVATATLTALSLTFALVLVSLLFRSSLRRRNHQPKPSTALEH